MKTNLTRTEQANVNTCACIIAISATNKKLEVTSGKDWYVWAYANSSAKAYKHKLDMFANGTSAQDEFTNKARSIMRALKALEDASTTEQALILASMNSFFTQYDIPMVDDYFDAIDIMQTIASGQTHEQVLKRHFIVVGGRKHMIETIDTVETNYKKASEKLETIYNETINGIGSDLIHIAVVALMDLANVYKKLNVAITIDNLMYNSKHVFKAVHAYIYEHKKTQQRKKEDNENSDSKLGTKEAMVIHDTTSEQALAHLSIETVMRAVENSKLTAKTKQRYNDLIVCYMLPNMAKDNQFLSELWTCSKEAVKKTKQSFNTWLVAQEALTTA